MVPPPQQSKHVSEDTQNKTGPKINPNWKPNPGLESFNNAMEILQIGLPPGPPIVPMRYYINLTKGLMIPYIYSMMVYYDNFSLGCWLYLALHGSYGVCWIMKDQLFPDPSFDKKSTILSVIGGLGIVLCPYGYGAYLLASRQAP